MESLVPPGFRFHPTDEELVGYYLKKKVASQKIDLDVIRDIDLYRIEPWDLQERCRIGYEEQKEWYFFSHKDKKYPTGTRTNRATMAGFWKATGRDKAVYDKIKLIGMRKTLVFYKGRAPNGQKSDWIIHEYRLESDENGAPQEEGWVVCRAFKKRTTITCQTRNHTNHQLWDSFSRNNDHESSGKSSILDSVGYISGKQQNYICKKEIHEVDNLNSDDNFVELIPQLESPSMPLVKKHPLTSLLSSRCPTEPVAIIVIDEDHEEDTTRIRGCDDHTKNKMKHISTGNVTDWRALDKFVASQLSHEDSKNRSFDGDSRPNLGVDLGDDHYNLDVALLLSREEDNEINKVTEFLLSSTSASGEDYDNIIGI
ncbi:hypothetical protein MKW94_019562 [Papaver nudicaule]|uniref:NAC domain-containing protein n=1 Tax=Papaver nudicaule TaxID=74823 RepID=A0AA41VPX2_PAPNU|nr:hypothetical protein [Papaver nudicaule]